MELREYHEVRINKVLDTGADGVIVPCVSSAEQARHVLLRKLLPAEQVNRAVDRAVLHAGQGTVYTAAYAGRPVIGIPMQFEQQYNIDMLVRHGSAIRLSKNQFHDHDLQAAIDTCSATTKPSQPTPRLSPRGFRSSTARVEQRSESRKLPQRKLRLDNGRWTTIPGTGHDDVINMQCGPRGGSRPATDDAGLCGNSRYAQVR
jgi:hypothetical protein